MHLTGAAEVIRHANQCPCSAGVSRPGLRFGTDTTTLPTTTAAACSPARRRAEAIPRARRCWSLSGTRLTATPARRRQTNVERHGGGNWRASPRTGGQARSRQTGARSKVRWEQVVIGGCKFAPHGSGHERNHFPVPCSSATTTPRCRRPLRCAGRVGTGFTDAELVRLAFSSVNGPRRLPFDPPPPRPVARWHTGSTGPRDPRSPSPSGQAEGSCATPPTRSQRGDKAAADGVVLELPS